VFSGDRRLITVMCTAQVLGMLGMSSFAALLPGFIDEWSLSGTSAGWLNGVFMAGYAVAVIVLMPLTDRIDARRIFLSGSLLAVAATFGFAFLAEGFWSAMVFRIIAGIGMAGSYMPGLRLLTDRLEQTEQSRAVSLYTACYAIGTAASVYFSAQIGAVLGWRLTFALIALGPLAAFILVTAMTTPRASASGLVGTKIFDFRPVFKNRRAIAYIIAYTLHTGELMVLLSWSVAFLTFAAERTGGFTIAAIGLAGAIVALVGLPASILGNEGAIRFGRRRTITIIVAGAAATSCLVGMAGGISFTAAAIVCIVYGALIAGDSSATTAGTVASAEPDRQGATVALHSFIGFIGGFLGPFAFGVILDLSGGRDTVNAWVIAFAAIGLTTLIGPVILARWAQEDPVPGQSSPPEER
jgi:MFS family permease